MGAALAAFGWKMAEGAANNILDIGFNPIRTRQALKGQKQALEQQNAAALDLWNKTNYGAQMEHLKSAGLNPGLIYGMGGAGGQLGSSSGNVNPQQSDSGSMGMGIQAAMAQAQIENLKSQTAKNNAEAAKTAGVDTEAARAGITKTQVETDIAKLDLNFKNSTQMERIDGFVADMRKKEEDLALALNRNLINDATFKEQIEMIKAEYATELIKQEALKAGIKVDEQKVRNMVKELEFRNREITVAENGQLTNEGRLELDKYTRDLPDSWKEGIRFVGDVMGKVLSPKIGVGKGKQKWTDTKEGQRFKDYWNGQ